jgi:hypothetical protein
MAVYKIIRIYEIPAESKIQATERMMEAIVLSVERDFHVMDFIKSPEDVQGKGTKVSFVLPEGWLKAIWQQVTGRNSKN